MKSSRISQAILAGTKTLQSFAKISLKPPGRKWAAVAALEGMWIVERACEHFALNAEATAIRNLRVNLLATQGADTQTQIGGALSDALEKADRILKGWEWPLTHDEALQALRAVPSNSSAAGE